MEKELFYINFIIEGLQKGESGIVILSTKSPENLIERLSSFHLDIKKLMDHEKFIMVDWYSHKIESIKDVKDEGSILRCSGDLKNVSIALAKALARIQGESTRVVAEILSPALSTHPLSEIYKFAQSCKARFDQKGATALFIIEKEMHEPEKISSLQQPFDGVVDITREKVNDKIVRKIGVLSMKNSDVPSSYTKLHLDSNEIWIGKKMIATFKCPNCKTQMKVTSEKCPGCHLSLNKKFIDRLFMVEKRIKLDPRDPNSWYARGATLSELRLYDKALKCFDTVLKLDKNRKRIWNNKADIYSKMGKFEDAARCYKKALEMTSAQVCPQFTQTFVEETFIEDLLKDLLENEIGSRYLKDLEIFAARLDEEPEDLNAWISRAGVLAKVGRYEDAINSLDQATKLDLKHTEAWETKGDLYQKLGDHKRATFCYLRAHESLDKTAACPICGNFVALNDLDCPKCGIEFEPELRDEEEPKQVDWLQNEEEESKRPKVKPKVVWIYPEAIDFNTIDHDSNNSNRKSNSLNSKAKALKKESKTVKVKSRILRSGFDYLRSNLRIPKLNLKLRLSNFWQKK
jgi:tetratricopeptide (TPR) repeat protein/KaiC/GvpD/RAD55 family RecA-like ATPase